MDIAIILTFRCNSRCSICNVWKHPSLPDEEISLKVLEKLPFRTNNLNLTGGEPTLRSDLEDIVDLLYPRTAQFEISSNGLRPERIYPLIKKYPDIKVRFSLEGFQGTNDLLRGEQNGFQKKVEGLRKLQDLGGKDLGFAITIRDDNADQLVPLFEFAERQGFELSTSILHNGFQFHKTDNVVYDRLKTARHIEELITAQLRTFDVKTWFRAYLNLGLAARALGHDRLLPCTAATDFTFIDPWGDVYACNVRPDLKIGNLAEQSWGELMSGAQRQQLIPRVAGCRQNCWMVGDAKTAMRHPRFTKLPRWTPLMWVIENKLQVMLGRQVDFDRYMDHSVIYPGPTLLGREEYSPSQVKRQVQRKSDPHYTPLGNYENR